MISRGKTNGLTGSLSSTDLAIETLWPY